MATLQKIRSKGPLLVVVIGLALFAFIAGDAIRIFEPHQNQTEVGVIDGEKLSAQEFQDMVEEQRQAQELLYGRQLNDNDLTMLRDQVWNTYVSYTLVKNEAEKLGLTVTDDEIANMIQEGTSPLLSQTPFVNPQTRMFDKAMMEMFISQAPKDQAALIMSVTEKQLKQMLLFTKYQALVMKSMISNPVAAENAFNGRINETDVMLALLPYSSIADSTVTVTDSDIKDLYNQRKEQYRNFVETRDIKYIDYVVTPSEADRQQTLEDVTASTLDLKKAAGNNYASVVRTSGSVVNYVDVPATKKGFPADIALRLDSVKVGEVYGPYYNQSDDSFNAFKLLSKQTAPDSIEFRQIQVIAATPAEMTRLADSIATAIKGGADFAALAQKYNGTNGESQWVASAQYEGQQLDPAYTKIFNALNDMDVKEVRNLDLGQGNLIIQVTNRKGMTNKYKAAVVKRPVEFSRDTYNQAYNKISQYLAANGNYDDFVKNAEDNGFRVFDLNKFRSDAHLVAGIQGTREALKWVYEADVKDVSQLYDCGNGDHLLIVAVAGINKEGYMPVNEVQASLRAELIRDKKAEQLMAELGKATDFQAATAIPNAITDSVKHISFNATAFVPASRNNEPALSALAPTAAANTLSQPLKGNGGVFVFQPYNQTKLEGEFNAETEEAGLNNRNMRWASQFMNDLLLKADVKDTRYLFF